MKNSRYRSRRAFSLAELLVVISLTGLLAGLLMPALAAARRQARAVVCRSNLRQLAIANICYGGDSDGFFVAAASDMWNGAGLCRWHGVRNSLNEPFDPTRGPLAVYLGSGRVKHCPERTNFIKGGDWDNNFEQGCGGYGYNMAYLGSRLWASGIATFEAFCQAYARTAAIVEVRQPAQTLMFADCAMSKQAGTLIEYSFAEPPFYVYEGKCVTDFYLSPSIHFRHGRYANVAWTDGHIDRRGMAKFDEKNVYLVQSGKWLLGWFEPVDNSLFDLQ